MLHKIIINLVLKYLVIIAIQQYNDIVINHYVHNNTPHINMYYD